MKKTREQLLVIVRTQRDELDRLKSNESLLMSSEQTKHKITLDKILEYNGKRIREDEDITVRDISLADFQIWNSRKINKDF